MAPTVTDELYAMLVKRADDLEGCAPGNKRPSRDWAIERPRYMDLSGRR